MEEAAAKALKREIRHMAGVAHERALAAELGKLEGRFAEWRSGEIDAFDLSAQIHRFHEGPARKLWIQFNTNSALVLGSLLGDALRTGTVLAEELSPAALAYLRSKSMI